MKSSYSNDHCLDNHTQSDPFFGKRAIVTGGTGGIGNVIGTALAARGAEVCLLGRNEESRASPVFRG